MLKLSQPPPPQSLFLGYRAQQHILLNPAIQEIDRRKFVGGDYVLYRVHNLGSNDPTHGPGASP
jgi:hypothetical protein